MTESEEYNFLKAYLSDDAYKEMYEEEDPIKFIKVMKHNWKTYLHVFSYVIAILGFIFGYIGFYKEFRGKPHDQNPFNIIYEIIRLFVFQNDFSTLIPLEWELAAARYLCPIALSYNILRVFGPLLQEHLKLIRLQFYRNHTIVCGLNKWTAQLLLDLKRDVKQMVVIEKDVNNEYNAKVKELGVILLNGDFSDYYLLNRANIYKAKYLIVFTEDDSKNMEIAINVKRLMEKETNEESVKKNHKTHGKKVRCFIHIKDKCLCDSFSNHDIFEQTYENIEMNLFNVYENDARVLFLTQAFETKLEKGDKVHLLIIGFSDLGESVALQAAKIGHYADDKGMRITVLEENAEELGKRFLARYPGINNIRDYLHSDENNKHYFEFTFRNVNLKNLKEVEKDIREIHENQRITAIIICLEDKTSGIKIGIHLMSNLKSKTIDIKLHFPIQVYLDENEDIFNLPNLKLKEDKHPRLSPFGLIKSTCSKEIVLNENLDNLAKLIHETYNNLLNYTDKWEEIPSDFKDSNRNQADHLPIKLRALNIKIVKASRKRKDFRSFTDEEIEKLSKMEHNRWCAERWLSGWIYTDGEKNKKEKLNPLLKPYEQFTEEEIKTKEIDREFIRNIDKFIKKLGLELRE